MMEGMGNIHQGKSCGNSCCGLCCTKLEGMGVTIGKTEILKDVNLHIHCGELTAIIGPNGAGKSTLLKAMLGQVKSTGNLRYMSAGGERNGKPVIGYVPQYLDFDAGTPTSVLDLFLSCSFAFPVWLYSTRKKVAFVEECLSKVKASQLINKRLGSLSGGELQRVLLALALNPLPDLLLLDEPVSGIDHNGMAMFYEMVSEFRKSFDLSIILVSHDLDLVYQYADRVVLLNKTVLENGKPQEVFNSGSFYDVFSLKWKRTQEQKGGAN